MAAGSKNKLEILPEIQGKVLKAAREKMRYKPEDLAHKACLAKKHIIELEEGGISSFYSEAHKVTVAKKIAKLLELDESQVLIHPDGDAVKQKTLAFDLAPEEPAAPAQESVDDVPPAPIQKTVPVQEKVNLENIKTGDSGKSAQVSIESGKRAGALALIALVLVGLYVTKDNIIELVRPTPEPPKAEATQEPVVEEAKPESNATPSPATPAAPTTTTPAVVADAGCPKADPTPTKFTVTDPTKPGNFVYVVTKSKQTVCVIDASGKSTMQTIDAGANHTFTGKAPFTVLTNGLSQVNVYFQGRPVKPASEQVKTLSLQEKN